MSNTLAFGKKAFSIAVVATTIAWTVGSAALAPLAASAATTGDLIRGSLPAVYYYGADGKRYVFPNEKTYKTWYSDFSTVKTITDAELAAIAIGGNVTYKPQAKMVKITTSPTVYVVTNGGALRAIASEAEATALYGADWNKKIDDVPDAFFTNYTVGAVLTAGTTLASLGTVSASIGTDKNLSGTGAPVVAGALTLSLAADSPAAASAPVGSGEVIATKALFSGTGKVKSVKVMRSGLSVDADLASVKLFDGTTQLGTTQTGLDANHQATFTLTTPWEVSGSKTLTIAVDIAAINVATGGNAVVMSINAAADVVLEAGTVGGTFPVKGNAVSVSGANILGALTATVSQTTPTAANVDAGNTSAVTLLNVALLAGANEDVEVTRFVAQKAGTHIATDISGLELYNVTTAAVLASSSGWNADSLAIFDLSAAPLKILKGATTTVEVRVPAGKIVAGSARTLSAQLPSSSPVSARGTTYNLGIVTAIAGAVNTPGAVITINAGQITVVKSASTPATGNIAPGAENEKLAALDLIVKGEALRATTTRFTFAAGTMQSQHVTACVLRDKNGATVAGPVNPSVQTAATLAASLPTVTFSSTITYPVGTSTYSFHCNISSSVANGVTAQVGLVPNAVSLVMTGVSTGNTVAAASINNGVATAVNGNLLTVAGGALTVINRSTPVLSTTVPGASNIALTQIALDASTSGEDVRVSQIVVTDDLVNAATVLVAGVATAQTAPTRLAANVAADVADWTNLRLTKEDGTTLVADIQQPSASVGANGTVTFTLSPSLVVAKKTIAIVKLFGDYKSGIGAAGESHLWRLVDAGNITSTGVTTGTAIAETMSPATTTAVPAGGQTRAFVAAGTLTFSLDASSPTADIVVAGKSGVTMTVMKLLGANDTTRIERLMFTLGGTATPAGAANIAKVYLYEGSTKLAESVLNGATPPTNTIDISAANFTVKDKETRYLTLKADLNDTNSGATSGHTLALSLAAIGDVTATSLSSGGAATIVGAPTGAIFTVRKTVPAFTLGIGNKTALTVSTTAKVLEFGITADSAANVVFNQGTGVAADEQLVFDYSRQNSAAGSAAAAFNLKKADGTTLDTATIDLSAATTSTGTLTFNFSTAALTVVRGTTETLFVEGNLTGFSAAGNYMALSLANTTVANVTWSDDSVRTITGESLNKHGLPVTNTLTKA